MPTRLDFSRASSFRLELCFSPIQKTACSTALCVLVKTKEPKIEWHVTKRSGEDLADFLVKADYVAREIAAGRFYKRPGKWCSWCDYLPVCVKDEKRIKEILVKITYSK